MTSEISQHYEGLLAPNYTWMFGVPFEVNVSEQMALLKHLLDVKPPCSGRAIDLVGPAGTFGEVSAESQITDKIKRCRNFCRERPRP